MADLPQSIARPFEIISTAQNQLLKPNKLLNNAVSNSKANSIPPIAIGPSQGAYLSILCQLIGAKHVLEIGTLGGYSTIWFAQSSLDIHVTSIEFSPKHRDVAMENTKELKNVEIILGAALDVLPKLAEQGKVFDFVFIDASWDEQKEYFDWAVKLTRPKGCIYVDNAVRQLTETNDAGEPESEKSQALIEHLKTDDRVQATLIPTFNTHKRTMSEIIDGFVMAVKV